MKTRLFFALIIFLALLSCKTTEKAVNVNAETPLPEQDMTQPAAREQAQSDDGQESETRESSEAREIQQARENAEISEIPPEQEIDFIPPLDTAHEFPSTEELAELLPFEDGEETAAAEPSPQADETERAQQVPLSQTETPPRTLEQPPAAANAAQPAPPAVRPQESSAVPPPEQMPEQDLEISAQAQEPQSEESGTVAESSRRPLDVITSADDIVPSRSVTVNQNQLLTATYPGAGWIYLGEVDAAGLFSYHARAPEQHNPRTKATTFTLKAQKQGTSYLHFYREDFLTNAGIDDYLEATVIPPRTEQEISVNAPDYQIGRARVIAAQNMQGGPARNENIYDTPPAQDGTVQGSVAQNNSARGNSVQIGQTQTPSAGAALETEDRGTRSTTVIQQSATQEKTDAHIAIHGAAQPPVNAPAHFEEDTAELYELALKAYNAGDQPLALDYINRFLANTNANIDKGLFLKGEILETSSLVQNIRDSYAAYNRLVREFPASGLWQQAKNRITYLDKFYFSIR